MYYPYLRGKQFELIMLRDKAEFFSLHEIHPIIEPVRQDFKGLVRALDSMNNHNCECTLIVNPQAGENPIQKINILEELIEQKAKKHKNISLGYIMHSKSDISNLVDLVEKYSDFSFSILHYGYSDSKKIAKAIEKADNIKRHIFIEGFVGKLYQRHLKRDGVKRILIRDGFKSQKKNALYPPSEHFSDLHITYSDEGVDGFGDYLTVGDDFTESGGPAYAIAIHLTYLGEDEDMYIYHFLSDKTDSPTDPAGKFLEALFKLANEVEKPDSKIFKSEACLEYLNLFDRKHYPGLGYAKKLSMQHHVELLAHYILDKKLNEMLS